MPPTAEQERIRQYIEKTSTNLAKLQVALSDSLQLLKERRAALVTVAVTGQIDLEEEIAA